MEYEIHNTQYPVLNTTHFKFMSIVNPTLAHFRHFSTLFTNLPSTSVENLLQIRSILTNKPNSPIVQIHVKYLLKMIYVNSPCLTKVKNKANSNPICIQYPVLLLNFIFTICQNGIKIESIESQNNVQKKCNFLQTNMLNSLIRHNRTTGTSFAYLTSVNKNILRKEYNYG
jgi:hypothetical protein